MKVQLTINKIPVHFRVSSQESELCTNLLPGVNSSPLESISLHKSINCVVL